MATLSDITPGFATLCEPAGSQQKGSYRYSMSPLRQFLYRFPRFESRTRVDFISKDAIFLGCCVEISESGLRGTFEGPVPPGTEGLMTLYTADMSFSAHAVILGLSADEVTARFQFHSPQEESSIRAFIKRLAP